MTTTVVLQLIISGLVTASLYALLASGLTLIYGAVGIVNFIQGQFLMLGAFITYWLFTLFGINPMISLIIASLVATLIGCALYLGLFQRILRRSRSREEVENLTLLITFGLILILENSSAIMWSATPRVYDFASQVYSFGGISLLGNRLLSLLFCATTVFILYLIMRKTWFGRGARYMIQDKEMAGVVGVNNDKMSLFCCGIGLATASMAGVFYSMIYATTPFIGAFYTLTAWVVIIFGGVGSIAGAIAGGLIIGLLESVGVYILSPAMKVAINYIVLVIVLLFRPRGIFRA